MNMITLTNTNPSDQTMVPNIFIDSYMPSANGSYVKVYLYLLRCLTNQKLDLSITYLADRLDNTENDIIRALNYWEKYHLLTIGRDERGEINQITLNPLSQEISFNEESAAADEISNISVSPDDSTDGDALTIVQKQQKNSSQFPRPTYTNAQIMALTSHDDIKWLLNIIPIYLERTLKPTDVQLILYFYETLGFSAELITHLYDYCVSKNKKNAAYIEAVALSWAEEGIDTVEKAQVSINMYNSSYQAVNKAFGLNRLPGTAEKKFIDKWVKQYGFDNDIIMDACSRSLLHTGKPDFKYANKILETWHKKGVKHLSDIKQLDTLHQARSASNKNSAPVKVSAVSNKFGAFPQRNYTKDDYSSLEQKLLHKQTK